MTTQHMYH